MTKEDMNSFNELLNKAATKGVTVWCKFYDDGFCDMEIESLAPSEEQTFKTHSVGIMIELVTEWVDSL